MGMIPEGVERPTLPEREAIALTKALRNTLPEGVVFSVFAFISSKGVRALNMCTDLPDGRRVDMNFRADKPTSDIARHARTRIVSTIANA